MHPDDLDDMATLLGDPRVMRHYPQPKSRQEAAAWIAWNRRLYRDHGFGLWLVTLRGTGEFVGDCGLTPQRVDGVTEIEVGYHVRAGLQGRGLATEAATACRDHARDVLGLGRLVAIIDPGNRPSQRVAEKLGLRVERESDNHGRWSSPRRIYAMRLGWWVGDDVLDTRDQGGVMTQTPTQLPGYTPGSYQLDPGHSDVAFTVRHMMVSKVRGHFTRVQAEITLAPDPLDSQVNATIDPNSIDTNNPQRDQDLRSANFFGVDQYPTMSYRSTGVRAGEDGFDLDGELTVHGVTRPLTLALDVHGFTKDPYGGYRVGFSATGELDRKAFDITTNIPLDGGGVVIGDTIQLFIEVEAILQTPTQP
jgi:polyisoprenoid-binding protein YceI/RimJ/RimL family protein N-acetyltransferase